MLPVSSRTTSTIPAQNCDVPARDVVALLLERAYRALPRNAEESGEYLVRARALLQAGRPLAADASRESRRQPLAQWQIRRIHRYIEEHLESVIQIEHLAAAAHLSKSHFFRAFHRTLGQTPADYLRRRRIERAQQLMLTTRRSLAQIALDCGLADQAHLTRMFRRIVGETPGAWRGQQQTIHDGLESRCPR